MNGMLSDEEIDEMYADAGRPQQAAQVQPPPAPPPGAIPLYPIGLAQAPQQQQNASSNGGGGAGITKKLGPLPVWGWGAIALGLAGTGYFWWRSRKAVKPNDADDSSGVTMPMLPPSTGGGRGGWQPSRSAFASNLDRYFEKKGMKANVTVWHDADDAKKKGRLKHVSPLVNVQVKGGAVKVDPALTKFCRREGLNPVQHNDGSIGLYPHTGKRGKEWEQYVDDLRDEGQSV